MFRILCQVLKLTNKRLMSTDDLEDLIQRLTEKESRLDQGLDRLDGIMTRLENISSSQTITPPVSPKSSKTTPSPKKRTKKKKKISTTRIMVSRGIRLHPNYAINFDYSPSDPHRERSGPSGSRRIEYKDGDVKTIYSDGSYRILHGKIAFTHFANGDKMEVFADGTTAYYYISGDITELTLTNGDSYYLFPNGQRETHSITGEKLVIFPDGTQVRFTKDGKATVRSLSGPKRRKKRSSSPNIP